MKIRMLMAPAETAAPAAPVVQPPVTRLSAVVPGGGDVAPGARDPGAVNHLDSLFESPTHATDPKADPKPVVPPAMQDPVDDRAATDSDQTKTPPVVEPKKEEKPVQAEEPEDDLENALKGKTQTKEEPVKEAGKDEPKKEEEDPSLRYRTNPELRSAFKTTVEKNKTLVSELTQAKTKLKEYEAGAPTTVQVEQLTKQLESERMRNNELETNLRVHDYRKSQEYITKYQQPIDSVVDEVKGLMPMLKVIVPAAEEGGQPTRRPATMEDFMALFHSDPGDVDQKAVDMFGASASRVITKLDQVKHLGDLADRAHKESGKLAAEHRQKTETERMAVQEQAQRAFRETIDELSGKHPEIFGAKVEDPKEKEILSKGLSMIDQIFANGSKMPPDQRGRLDAMVRMRAGSHGLLLHRIRKQTAEIEAKDKIIAELKDTEPKLRPDGTKSSGSDSKETEGDLVDGIDSIPTRRS